MGAGQIPRGCLKPQRTGVRSATIAPVTDMRATDRLLRFIGERTAAIMDGSSNTVVFAEEINEAVRELQRRGDTLVGGRDVQAVATAAFRWLEKYRGLELGADDELAHAIERLENAIGGAS